MTLYLLIVRLQTFLSIPITQQCLILSCDTLVANERYVYGIRVAEDKVSVREFREEGDDPSGVSSAGQRCAH
jgi:hypothetical protein